MNSRLEDDSMDDRKILSFISNIIFVLQWRIFKIHSPKGFSRDPLSNSRYLGDFSFSWQIPIH